MKKKTNKHSTEEIILIIKRVLNRWKKSCINVKNQINVEFLADLEIELTPKKKIPKNVKCTCGHVAADHFQNSGYCHHSLHANPGLCGCTWYHPNDKWIIKQQKKKAKLAKQ